MERPVCFSCGKDVAYGILHIPEEQAVMTQRKGILFLNAGLRYRIGPSRQYVRYARKLCQDGFAVLLFDVPGIGDSGGVLKEVTDYRPLVAENTDSTKSAIDFFIAETGIKRVGLLGLCGGAHNAILSGALDPRVDAIVLLSLPVEQLGDVSSAVFFRVILHDYFRKVLQWRSWLNLILLRSNFRWMFKALGQLGKSKHRNGIVDETLWRAFKICMANGKSTLFVYGEKDPFYQTFPTDFGRRLSKLSIGKRPCYDVYVVEKSDHIFSHISWQNMVINKTISWLQDR